jgi:hypothetical protein
VFPARRIVDREHKDRFGVEPICAVLTEHGCPIGVMWWSGDLPE